MTFLVGRDLTQCLLRGHSHIVHLSPHRVIEPYRDKLPVGLFDFTDDFCSHLVFRSTVVVVPSLRMTFQYFIHGSMKSSTNATEGTRSMDKNVSCKCSRDIYITVQQALLLSSA
jgi:hypothetical protein